MKCKSCGLTIQKQNPAWELGYHYSCIKKPKHKKLAITKEKDDIVFIVVVNDFTIFRNTIENNRHMMKHDVVYFNNEVENTGIPERYNSFIDSRKKESWFIFCHQDFEFLSDISEKIYILSKDIVYGVIGAEKTEGIWSLYGQIYQKSGNRIFKLGIPIDGYRIIKNVDCQCMIIHSSIFHKHKDLRFDTNLKFHQYSEEFSMNAFKNFGIKTAVVQLDSLHKSLGALSPDYHEAVSYINKKHGIDYYISTCNKGKI